MTKKKRTYRLELSYADFSAPAWAMTPEVPVRQDTYETAQAAVDAARQWIVRVTPPAKHQPRAAVLPINNGILGRYMFMTWIADGEVREGDCRKQDGFQYTVVHTVAGRGSMGNE